MYLAMCHLNQYFCNNNNYYYYVHCFYSARFISCTTCGRLTSINQVCSTSSILLVKLWTSFHTRSDIFRDWSALPDILTQSLVTCSERTCSATPVDVSLLIDRSISHNNDRTSRRKYPLLYHCAHVDQSIVFFTQAYTVRQKIWQLQIRICAYKMTLIHSHVTTTFEQYSCCTQIPSLCKSNFAVEYFSAAPFRSLQDSA